MLKKYFSNITLFTVMAVVSLTAFIITAISRQPEELKTTLLYNIAIAIISFVCFDVLLKQILKLKKGWLWIAQVFLLLVAVYIWVISE